MAKKAVFLLIALAAAAGAAGAMEFASGTMLLNVGDGIGTSTPSMKSDGGSTVTGDTALVQGAALSFEWIPSGKTGLSYGVETGFYVGGYYDGIFGHSFVMAIPALFRLGWHPAFIKVKNLDVYLLGKAGWTFGFWGGDAADRDGLGNPSGISFGSSIGIKYFYTPVIGIFLEGGFNTYRLNASYDSGTGNNRYTNTIYAPLNNYATLGVSWRFGGKQVR